MMQIDIQVMGANCHNNVYLNGCGKEPVMVFQLHPDSYRGTGVDSDHKHYLSFQTTMEFLDELESAIKMIRRIQCPN